MKPVGTTLARRYGMYVGEAQVQKIEIDDRPGALQELFAGFSAAGANVLNISAFSVGGGKGAAFIIADKPDVIEEYARSKGLAIQAFAGFLLNGRDEIGVGATVTGKIADAGVNVAVFTATVIEADYRVLLVVAKEDADKVASVLG